MKTKLTLAILILTTTLALADSYVYKCPTCGYIMTKMAAVVSDKPGRSG